MKRPKFDPQPIKVLQQKFSAALEKYVPEWKRNDDDPFGNGVLHALDFKGGIRVVVSVEYDVHSRRFVCVVSGGVEEGSSISKYLQKTARRKGIEAADEKLRVEIEKLLFATFEEFDNEKDLIHLEVTHKAHYWLWKPDFLHERLQNGQ